MKKNKRITLGFSLLLSLFTFTLIPFGYFFGTNTSSKNEQAKILSANESSIKRNINEGNERTNTLSNTFYIDANNEAINYTYNGDVIKDLSQINVKSQANGRAVFGARKQNNELKLFIEPNVDVVGSSSGSYGFWGMIYKASTTPNSNYASDFILGKMRDYWNNNKTSQNGYSFVNGKPRWSNDAYNRYNGKNLNGVISFSQMTYFNVSWLTTTHPKEMFDAINSSNQQKKLYKYLGEKKPWYDYADESNGNWLSVQHQFGAYDGYVWTGTTPSSVSLKLKTSNYNGTVYDFISNFETLLPKYLTITASNSPKDVFGKHAKETKVYIEDMPSSSQVKVQLVTPRSYKPSTTLIKTADDGTHHYDSQFKDPYWIKNTSHTVNLVIPYSFFKTNNQTKTSIKSAISIRDISIPNVSSSTYTQDVLDNAGLKENIISYINNNPDKFFDNPPNKSELNGRTIIDSTTTPTFSLSSDGNSLYIDTNYVAKNTYENQPGLLTSGRLVITGFNSSNTVVKSTKISAIGDVIAKMTPSSVNSATNAELLSFLRRSITLSSIFSNYPQKFISHNETNLVINKIVDWNDYEGTLTIEITAKDYAKINEGKNGYGDISTTLTISDMLKKSESSIKPSINVANLGIANINGSTYSIDMYNYENLKNELVNHMLNNPSKYVNDVVTDLASDIPYFTDVAISSFDSTSITVVGNFVYKYYANQAYYKPFTTKIIGFNSADTNVKIEYRNIISNTGLEITGFSDRLISEIIANPNELQLLTNKVLENLEIIFENYSQYFIQSNKSSATISISSYEDKTGTAIIKINTVNAMSSAIYTSKQFEVKISGFKKYENPLPSLATSEISINQLLIPGISNSMYTIDIYENKSYIDSIRSYMNNYPSRFINNPISNPPAGVNQFKFELSDVSYEYNKLIINVQFLTSVDKYNTPTYSKGKVVISDFNDQETMVSSNYTTSGEGYIFNNLSNYLPSELNNENGKNILTNNIKNNLANIFENYAQAFLTANKNNLAINEYTYDDDLGTAVVKVAALNAYTSNGYVNKLFEIKIGGFRNSNSIASVKPVNINYVSSSFKEIFGSTGIGKGFQVDWTIASNLNSARTLLLNHMNNNKNMYFNNSEGVIQVLNTSITFDPNDKNTMNVAFTYQITDGTIQADNSSIKISLRDNPTDIDGDKNYGLFGLQTRITNVLNASAQNTKGFSNNPGEITRVKNIIINTIKDYLIERESQLPDAMKPTNPLITFNKELEVIGKDLNVPTITIGSSEFNLSLNPFVVQELFNQELQSSTISSKGIDSRIWILVGIIVGSLFVLFLFILLIVKLRKNNRRKGGSYDYDYY